MRISDWSSDVCSSDLYIAWHTRASSATRGVDAGSAIDSDPTQWGLHFRRASGSRGTRGPDHRSEEHTSELQSLMRISYAVFCLKKKKQDNKQDTPTIAKQLKSTIEIATLST